MPGPWKALLEQLLKERDLSHLLKGPPISNPERATQRITKGESPHHVLTEEQGYDVSPTARHQRATDQGYLPEPQYHGTSADVPEFREDKFFRGAVDGVHTTSDPYIASSYADPLEGGNLLSLRTKPTKNKLNSEYDEPWPESGSLKIDKVRDPGDYNLDIYSDWVPDYPPHDLSIYPDPSDLRSPHASFNPNWTSFRDLLASPAPLTAATAATAAGASTLLADPTTPQAHPLDKLIRAVRPRLDDILTKNPNILTTPSKEPQLLFHSATGDSFPSWEHRNYPFTSFSTDLDFANNWNGGQYGIENGQRIIPGLGRGDIFDYTSPEDRHSLFDTVTEGLLERQAAKQQGFDVSKDPLREFEKLKDYHRSKILHSMDDGDWDIIENYSRDIKSMPKAPTGFNTTENGAENIMLFDANKDFFPLFDLDRSKGSSY